MLEMMLAARRAALPAPVGQIVFTAPSQLQVSTSWTVPERVTEIWAVCVGNSTSATEYSDIRRGTLVLIGSQSTVSASVAGGDAGAISANGNAGSGAGGYTGNGGAAAVNLSANGSSGSGGGGGGGAGGTLSGTNKAGDGGGVGLLGQGTSGSGGVFAGPKGGGDGSIGDAYGAGASSYTSDSARRGCNLRYTVTPIAVTAGEVLQIRVKGKPGAASDPAKTAGAIRIMWGGGRSYPNNAGDLPEVL